MQFKVSDLQLLLGFAGQNKGGRKPDLQRKAINLITNKMSIPLEMKIRHIYREMLENEAFSSHPVFSGNFEYNCFRNGYSTQAAPRNGYDTCDSYCRPSESRYIEDWARKNSNYPSYSQPQDYSFPPARETNSFNIAVPLSKTAPNRQKLSNIEFKKLSFFNFKSEIMAVTPMVPKVKLSDSYEYTATFTLDPAQHTAISWATKHDKESRFQIQLRICELSDDLDSRARVEVSDSLPLALGVRVNDKSCQLPPAIPSTNKQGMLLKRMNAPVNLTPQSRKNHVNSLSIQWSIESGNNYAVAVHLVEKYTSDELIDKLKQKGERDPAITKKYLSDKLDELGDDDIAATSLKVSLVCPLGKIPMSLPTRATTCNHLQCFDGSLFIKMNEVKSTWQCPVCNQTGYYEDLFIDGFFMNLLRSGICKPNVTDIQINADGSVVPVVPKKRPAAPGAEAPNPKKKSKTRAEEKNESFKPYKSISKTEEINECSTSDYRPVEEPRRNVESDFSRVPSLPSFVPLFSSKSSFGQTPSNAAHSSASWERLEKCTILEKSALVSDETDDKIKKNVVLVDLTESDSESVDSRCSSAPLNLMKPKDDSSSSEQNRKKSPPVYDIDDSDYT